MKMEYEKFGMKSTWSYCRPPSYAAYIGKMKAKDEKVGMKSRYGYYYYGHPPSYAAAYFNNILPSIKGLGLVEMKVEDEKVGRNKYHGGPPSEEAYSSSSSFYTSYLDELIDSAGEGFLVGAVGSFVYESIKSRRLTLSKVPRAAGFCALFFCLVLDAIPQTALLNPRNDGKVDLAPVVGSQVAAAAVMFAPRGLRVASFASLLTAAYSSITNSFILYNDRRV